MMTACCVSGYRPLRDIRLDECRWPPILAPAGPWEICDCADGDEVRRVRWATAVVVAMDEERDFEARLPDPAPPLCSTCPPEPDPGAVIEWNDRWRTWLCPECGAVLGDDRDG